MTAYDQQQINPVVGDCFKLNKELLKYTDTAADLIGWLHGNSVVKVRPPGRGSVTGATSGGGYHR